MEFGILHLTDIHFTVKTDIQNRIGPLCSALHKDIKGVKKLYIIISGDIAYGGKADEYHVAKQFISNIKLLTANQFPGIEIRIVMVPGNHDCDLHGKDSSIRKIAIQNTNYDSIGQDNSVIDTCTEVQEDFWKFYENWNSIPSDKMYYKIEDTFEGEKVIFHCINTAWMSQLNEKTGGLFFPVKRYNELIPINAAYNFGVWHHPYNWLTPNTPENNKKEFERFTEHIATTHFFGHEHEKSFYTTENVTSGKKINLLSGEVFNEDKKKTSGFQTLIVNIKDKTGVLRQFSFEDGMYITKEENSVDLKRETVKTFKQNVEFAASLEEIKIPLVIEGRKDIRQSQIFVWPDIDNAAAELSFDNYQNSQRLLDDDYDYCVLDGESQIGKSTLLSMLYSRLYDRGKVPLMLQGKDIKDANVEKVAKRYFRQQYVEQINDYDRYSQLPIEQKVLLIDDFQDTGFNPATVKEFLDTSIKKFGKVIIIFDSTSLVFPANQVEFHGIKFYNIKPLGFKKRNELIERYQLLKVNPNTVNEHDFAENVKTNFDNVQAILGDKLMPSFPLYILSILQALEYKPLKQNETSYGYCYQTLIHYSLHKAGVGNEDIDAYMNFLAELAYFFIKDDVESKPRREVNKFHLDYSENYFCPSYETMIKALKRSKILQDDNDNIKFGYNYILYYLSAKRIADVIHEQEGKAIVEALFSDLQNERNANILVFITHHSRDISFIENCLLNSMIVLEKNIPITLERNDVFYNEISEFVEDLKEEILETNRNPIEEREKMLQSQDQHELVVAATKKDVLDQDFEEVKTVTRPFQQAFRSIEIVGQIIKNRRGSLHKDKLREMISELYTTGFRTIRYISEMLKSSRTEIIEMVNEETQSSESAFEIEKQIHKFVQFVSLNTCLSVFTKLMRTAGNKDLKPLYIEVAKSMGTPAAKLVTFAIISYYGKVTTEEVKTLAEDFKNNQVALSLLRARVRSYVYNRNLDYKTKQQFASILGMKPSATSGTGKE